MTPFTEATWRELENTAGPEPERFDRASLDDVPPPAQRLLAASLPQHTPLHSLVCLGMAGEMRLAGRWLPFTAKQILCAGIGFVWAPIVGGRILRFTGADALGPRSARMEFRLHGRIPVVNGSGPDVERSAAGRLAAETAAWLPQALTPQAGARWDAVDDSRAAVTLDAAGQSVRVEVAVDADGRMRSLGLARWRDATKPPGYAPFGGTVDSILEVADGVQIAGSGSVGWGWHTEHEAEGVFFRYRITSADFGPPPVRRFSRETSRFESEGTSQ